LVGRGDDGDKAPVHAVALVLEAHDIAGDRDDTLEEPEARRQVAAFDTTSWRTPEGIARVTVECRATRPASRSQ
jgi:hypothetical protein